jgi:MYXO-CTERM domain-containing protein
MKLLSTRALAALAVVTTTAGSGWAAIVNGPWTAATTNARSQWAPGAGPTFSLGADVRFAPTAAWDTKSTFGFKGAGATPSLLRSPDVVNPANMTQRGRAANSYSYTRTGIFGQNINYRFSFRWEMDVGTGAFVATSAWHGDPFEYMVDNVGGTAELDHFLSAGTAVSAAGPGLTMAVRFGTNTSLSGSASDALSFWNTAADRTDAPNVTAPGVAPAGHFDLFSIRVYDGGAGIQADVLPAGMSASSASLAGFNVTSSRSLSAMKAMLESPGAWARSGDTWTLNADLPLFTLTFTNMASMNVGHNMAMGVFTSNAEAVPTPGAAALAVLGLAAMIRRRRG